MLGVLGAGLGQRQEQREDRDQQRDLLVFGFDASSRASASGPPLFAARAAPVLGFMPNRGRLKSAARPRRRHSLPRRDRRCLPLRRPPASLLSPRAAGSPSRMPAAGCSGGGEVDRLRRERAGAASRRATSRPSRATAARNALSLGSPPVDVRRGAFALGDPRELAPVLSTASSRALSLRASRASASASAAASSRPRSASRRLRRRAARRAAFERRRGESRAPRAGLQRGDFGRLLLDRRVSAARARRSARSSWASRSARPTCAAASSPRNSSASR